MQINIRKEVPQDFHRVEDIAREAFWNLYFPGAHEHFVVNQLRRHKDYKSDISRVIEVDGQVQGAIFYTASHVLTHAGEQYKTISFGPMFIAPEFHRKGLGRQLIEHTLALAKEKGLAGVITLGYPYHYAPYGFVGAKKYGISMGDGKFYKGLLALPLQDGALTNCAGQAVFSPVFEVKQEDVDIFDARFAPKEKAFQESQKEYERACALLDE